MVLRELWNFLSGKTMQLITEMIATTGKSVMEAGREVKNSPFTLASDAFRNGGSIPPVYTCKGQGISPKLIWSNVPSGIGSFALMMEDPDAPGSTFSHWVIYNIPAEKRELPSSLPSIPLFPDGTRQGMNDFRRIGYGAPCPPPGKPHRYYFRIFALKALLKPSAAMDRTNLLHNVRDQLIEKAELIGLFGR